MTRNTQIQVKVTNAEKALFEEVAQQYNLTTAAFARHAMEYVAIHRPVLQIRPVQQEMGQNGKAAAE